MRGVDGEPGAGVRHELEERVDRQKLNAGPAEDLVARHEVKRRVHRAVSSLVAIADRIFEQDAVGIGETVIDAPGVDANTLHAAAQGPCAHGRVLQSLTDFASDALEVPAKMPVDAARRVGEAADFFDEQLFGSHAPEKDASGPGAEIDGDEKRGRHPTFRRCRRWRTSARAGPSLSASDTRWRDMPPRDRSRPRRGSAPWRRAATH